MLFLSIAALALACVVFLVVLRSRRRQLERDAWMVLALRFPSSDETFEGTRIPYPDADGEAVIGEEGFRARPSSQLPAIDVPWSDVRTVKAHVGGGLSVRVQGGVVILPGQASAVVADIIGRRAKQRSMASA